VRISAATNGAYPPEVAGAVYFCWLALLEQAPTGAEPAIVLRDEGSVLTFELETTTAAVPDVMRDRIEALGGSVTSRSGPGDGTRVTASLPLRR
jgi:signal transduction histidine kinase